MFGNLLAQALSVIPPQGDVAYLRAVGTITNTAGYDEHTFADPVPVPLSSVQAVPRISYGFLNLDYTKDYVTWYVPREVIGIARDSSGDRMTYSDRLYQCQNVTDWNKQDGWVAVICVDITGGTANA